MNSQLKIVKILKQRENERRHLPAIGWKPKMHEPHWGISSSSTKHVLLTDRHISAQSTGQPGPPFPSGGQGIDVVVVFGRPISPSTKVKIMRLIRLLSLNFLYICIENGHHQHSQPDIGKYMCPVDSNNSPRIWPIPFGIHRCPHKHLPFPRSQAGNGIQIRDLRANSHIG